MPAPRHIALILAAAAGLARVAPARAQASDLAAANALFDEGKQLSAAGRTAEACARFEASLALVPQLGVQLNLADCYERLGRTASAWLAFGDALALARRATDHARWTYAQQRQAALKPRLARLVITVAAEAPPALTVTRDGAVVRAAAYDVAVPVDPGDHVVEATAPGVAWSTHVTVEREGEQVSVAVPALAPVTNPAPPTAPPASPPPPVPDSIAAPAQLAARWEPGPRQPGRAAWITAGVGLAGLGLGAYFGLSARALSHEALRGCDQSHACSAPAFATSERSRRDATLATAMFAAAGAALAASAVLYLTAPRARVHVAPAVAARAGGLTVKVGF